MVLLAKANSNGTAVVFSKALIESFISHDGFVIVNNVIMEYDKTKEATKN